ncbi:nitrogenase component 1 [Clostridiaceae bacterium M8S5]|nr:nitrogenase component 1 [Clostridiaceae bacterium M8S5]
MGLHRFKPIPSGRMGLLWTLSTIRDGVIIEYGCMGHMLYSGVTLKRAGIDNACHLYSTHINETDVSLGDTSRLEKLVKNIVKNNKPKAIFLMPSSVPELIGVDIKSIQKKLKQLYPDIHILYFGSGGFDKVKHNGVQEALTQLVKALTIDCNRSPSPTFNIIGSCADLFRFESDTEEIIRLVRGALGIEPLCILSSDTSIETIKQMGKAHINIVIRQEGKQAAKELKKRFNTPYIEGRPYGIDGTEVWLKEIAQILNMNVNPQFLAKEKNNALKSISIVKPNFKHIIHSSPKQASISIGGHVDVVQGILEFACKELSFIKSKCWCDNIDMQNDEIPYFTEKEWTEVVSEHTDGWLMASGEALKWSNNDLSLQIANPDIKWRIYPYEPPFVGFKGAVNLANLWINSYEAKHGH